MSDPNSPNTVRCYGIDAFIDFENYISIALENHYDIYYHDFHIFYEHKKLNLERFKYINNLSYYKVDITEYNDLVNYCNVLRLLYMKAAVKKGGIYSQVNDDQILLLLKERIHIAIEKEKKILSKALDLLQ